MTNLIIRFNFFDKLVDGLPQRMKTNGRQVLLGQLCQYSRWVQIAHAFDWLEWIRMADCPSKRNYVEPCEIESEWSFWFYFSFASQIEPTLCLTFYVVCRINKTCKLRFMLFARFSIRSRCDQKCHSKWIEKRTVAVYTMNRHSILHLVYFQLMLTMMFLWYSAFSLSNDNQKKKAFTTMGDGLKERALASAYFLLNFASLQSTFCSLFVTLMTL